VISGAGAAAASGCGGNKVMGNKNHKNHDNKSEIYHPCADPRIETIKTIVTIKTSFNRGASH
jgi:hypothetical protein